MGTAQRKKSGILSYRNEDFSRAVGKSLWEDCPLQEYLHDPSIGHLLDEHFHKYAAGDWTQTNDNSATVALVSGAGGVLGMTTDSSDNDGVELQMNHLAWQLAAGKPFWFETRVRIETVAANDVAIGLMNTDTDIIGDAGDIVVTDGIYFGNDNDGLLDFYSEASSSETTVDTGHVLADATWVNLGITSDGSNWVKAWVNGKVLYTAESNIPSAALRISYAHKNTGGAAKYLQADFVRAFQIT